MVSRGRRGDEYSVISDGVPDSDLLIATAKANRLESHAYLRLVFTELPVATTVEDIEALLPWAQRERPEIGKEGSVERLQIIACIEALVVIEKILLHLDSQAACATARRFPPWRTPPQMWSLA